MKDEKIKKTRETIEKLFGQAKESVKVLELLQREGMAKARSMMPSPEETLKMTNEKIVSTLRKMGFATRDDVRQLERKVDELASELRGQLLKLQKKTGSKTKTEPEAEA